MRSMLRLLRPYFAVLVVAGVFIWSAISIATHRAAESPPGTITLRMGHWQLESGVRDGLDFMAAEYAKLHPNVRIVQDAIPESTYGQWLTTQVMGGTAPDLIEAGMLPYPVLLSYYNRYFVPLTPYVSQPNPYNQGTELEGVPLRLTFKDAMRFSYVDEMQQYMSIPLSQFGVRIFYNRNLLKELTGLDEAPKEYRAFLRACDAIARRTNARGEPYVPIAGSKYHFGMWDWMMFEPLTYPAVRVADYNRDGTVGNDELFVAFKTGRLDFSFPAFKARFQMMREVTSYFQAGYTGLTRDEGVFLFAQQRAVFITTGTWDARSLQEQALGIFEVGVMEFPMPTPHDPDYGPIVEGPRYEKPFVGFPFAITRTSKHPDVALDFLLFMASQKNNEKLNQIIGWIPAIHGTEMDPLLRAFEPQLEGVYAAMNLILGGETWVKWTQLYSLFQVGQISYEQLAEQYEPFYLRAGMKDFDEAQRDWRRGMLRNEQLLAGLRAEAMAEGADSSRWVQYRALLASRQLFPELGHSRQRRLLQRGPETGAVGPYEYSAEVLAKVRAR